MNIGIRLHDTKGHSLEEHLIAAHEQGFSCVHTAMQKVIPGFQMMEAPRLLTPELAAECKALYEKYNLQCAVLGCYLNLATPDEEELRKTVDCYKAHLKFAAQSGALLVGTETGAPNTGYKTVPECWTEESLQLFIERLRPVVKYAEEVGAIIAIEPVCRHIVSTPERCERVLKAINSPALKVILDTVNLLTPENHMNAKALAEESIRRFGDQILVLHMKDYQVKEGAENVLSMACGTGKMTEGGAYDTLLSYAKAHPGIPMTLEDTVPDNAEAARLYLEDLAK